MAGRRTVFKFGNDKPQMLCDFLSDISSLPTEASSIYAQLIRLTTSEDYPIKGLLSKDGSPMELKTIFRSLKGDLPSVVKGWNLLCEKKYVQNLNSNTFCVTQVYNDWMAYRKRSLAGRGGQLKAESEQASLFEGIPVTKQSIEIEELKQHRLNFEAFMEKYPNKKGKVEAWKNWLKLMKEGLTAKFLWACLENMVCEVQTLSIGRNYIVHAKNFLHPKKQIYNDYAPKTWKKPERTKTGKIALVPADDQQFWEDTEKKEQEREKEKNG